MELHFAYNEQEAYKENMNNAHKKSSIGRKTSFICLTSTKSSGFAERVIFLRVALLLKKEKSFDQYLDSDAQSISNAAFPYFRILRSVSERSEEQGTCLVSNEDTEWRHRVAPHNARYWTRWRYSV